MKLTRNLFFLISFQFVTFNTSAQLYPQYNLNFKTYSTLQGLADNDILKTVKDKYGFLWIATHNGISRFDGLHFKNYTHNPADTTSLRSIWVTDLLLDDRQTVWATTEWGLCYYDEMQDRFRYINRRSDIQVLYKAPLCKGHDNILWVAAEDGLRKVNCITKRYVATSLTRIADPQFIIQQGENNYLIGTRGKGLISYNSLTNLSETISTTGLPADTHYTDAITINDTIWISTDAGLLEINGDTHNVYSVGREQLRGTTISQLMCVQTFSAAFGDQQLVCGTNDKKLLLFDKIKKAFVYQWPSNVANPDGFRSSVIYSLYSDDKLLWIGTNRGLCQLNMNAQQQQTYILPSLLSANTNILVKKVVADNTVKENLVWLIFWKPGSGIKVYNTALQKVVHEWKCPGKGNNKNYNDLIQSRSGGIIAVRDSAVDFFSAQKGLIKTIPVSSKLLCVYEDEHEDLWLGGDKGLLYVDVKTKQVEAFDVEFTGTDIEKKSFPQDFPVYDIKKMSDNTLWFTCIKYGLFSFDINEKKFTAHRQPFNTAYSTLNRCNSIEIIGDSVWVATMAGITCYIPAQDKFINYSVADGLKSSYVYSIVKDAYHNLWCRGNADIFYINTNTKKIAGYNLRPEFNVFYFLQKLSFAGNKIFTGHEGGFTAFNSAEKNTLPYNNKIPDVQITACRIENENIFFNKDSSNIIPVMLNHYQNEISFDFTAIEYDHPDEIEYWYSLGGMGDAWINGLSKTTISYSNLKPGNYNFKVFVKNRRNNIQSKTTSFLFIIKPAFWQRWWFWPLAALFFVLLVIYIAKRRVATIKATEKGKTAVNKMMAELETKMLRSQMNPHFIFNSLNSVQKYIWENKEEDAAEYLARFAKLIRAILENSRKETISLKEEMNVMKLYIELEHRRSNAHFDYQIKIDETLPQDAVQLPPLIMQPFIENAIWHGLNKKPTKGNLSVAVMQRDDKLVCIIDDDGVGRQQKTEDILTGKKSLGLEITQQRINRLMETTRQTASVIIEDKKEDGMAAGTRVIITLPLQIR